MASKRTHIVTSGRKTRQSATTVDAIVNVFVNVVQPKSKTKRSSAVTDVAKKSFAGMVQHKSEITSALRNGKSLTEIKGIRFVKPF